MLMHELPKDRPYNERRTQSVGGYVCLRIGIVTCCVCPCLTFAAAFIDVSNKEISRVGGQAFSRTVQVAQRPYQMAPDAASRVPICSVGFAAGVEHTTID
jgi:hypothetical protein